MSVQLCPLQIQELAQDEPRASKATLGVKLLTAETKKNILRICDVLQ